MECGCRLPITGEVVLVVVVVVVLVVVQLVMIVVVQGEAAEHTVLDLLPLSIGSNIESPRPRPRSFLCIFKTCFLADSAFRKTEPQ